MPIRFLSTKKVTSVGTSFRLFTGGIVAVALILTLGIGYVTTVDTMERESLRALQLVVDSRAHRESYYFMQAEDNVQRTKEHLLELLGQQDSESPELEFHKLFYRCDDGLWRVRPEFDDYTRRPTLYLQHDAELSDSLYRRAVASYRVLSERAPALVPPYYSLYMDFVERGLMVYSPDVDWGKNATRDSDNFNYPTMTGSIPENNPTREKFWTPVYFDEEADVWMVSVIEPLDWNEAWVGTVGHDLTIDALIQATLKQSLEGSYSLILSRDGQLIAHPEFTERILAAKGDLSLSNLNDTLLNRIAAMAESTTTFPAVLEDSVASCWYGLSRIEGPDWYIVTVYPKELVSRRAFQALALPISVGLGILVITLLLVNYVVRKSILRPLHYIDGAVSHISRGESVRSIEFEADNEFGRLARSFESMSEQLNRRKLSLEESRRDWERTFDTVREIIAILNPDKLVKQVNRNFLDRCETQLEACVGNLRTALLDENEREAYVTAFDRLVASRRSQHFVCRLDSMGGTFDVTLAPMFDDDAMLVGVVEVSRDISEQVKLEEQLRQAQKMDAVGQLAGGIAHDFNNLLQIILGYSEGLLLDLQPDDPGYVELLETQKAAERAASLTRQLLVFSRRQVIVTRSRDLNDVVHGAAKMIRRLIGEHIDLVCIPAADPVFAEVDQNQIEQVVMNLCINARDAMPDGGQLTIELGNILMDKDAAAFREWVTPGYYVQLVVSDSGTGMSAETRQHIFEPFFTTKDSSRGTGLGLATVYGIVRQHGGEIEVYSELGQGTTFRVFLPAASNTEDDAVELTNSVVPGGDECILVAEDDEQIQLLVKKVLQAEGYHVILAGDGAEAITCFEKHQDEVDMLLLDVIMPKANGKAVLEAIQKIRADIPCLFASGYSANALHTNFKLQQGLHLIEKPYQRTVLLRKIREVLDQRPAGNLPTAGQ